MALPKQGRAFLFVPALLLVATLGWPACRLQAQEDWARRDKWQRPAEVLDTLGLKPGGLLAIIDAQDEPGQPRSVYRERHTLPAEIVREDAARHGLRFQRELPGFSNPESKRKYYFLLFEKPKQI